MTANVAEGYGRFHFKENIQYCRIARGSAYELIDHLITCQDERYLAKEEAETLHRELLTFVRLLNGDIRSIGTSKRTDDSHWSSVIGKIAAKTTWSGERLLTFDL